MSQKLVQTPEISTFKKGLLWFDIKKVMTVTNKLAARKSFCMTTKFFVVTLNDLKGRHFFVFSILYLESFFKTITFLQPLYDFWNQQSNVFYRDLTTVYSKIMKFLSDFFPLHQLISMYKINLIYPPERNRGANDTLTYIWSSDAIW